MPSPALKDRAKVKPPLTRRGAADARSLFHRLVRDVVDVISRGIL
jgi:hypothetical protein